MFSASLLSMMVHSLPPGALGAFLGGESPSPSADDVRTIPHAKDMARRFESALKAPPYEWPRIPVIAHVDPDYFQNLAEAMPKDSFSDGPRGFLWGRIPLDVLIRRYLTTGTESVDREHLDLGTPIRAASGAAGSTCSTLLAQTPAPAAASVGAAVVDLGDPPTTATGAPRNFNGKLRHVPYAAPVDLSAHAESVLEVLLDRLNTNNMSASTATNILSITTVSMALVLNPTPDQVRASKDCFEQHCAPEMLTAIQAIDGLLNGDKLPNGQNLPAVVNMSLGTHVGPHNGNSPLEEYISGTLFRPCNRFLFAAAGNEGRKGISARLDLKTNETDYMDLVVDERCTELLVEFWWDDAGPADVEIVALIQDGGQTSRVVIRPGINNLATALTPASMGQQPPMSFLTLLHAQSHATMSCIAFAATRPAPAAGGQPLTEFRISFDLTAKSANATLHAWVVICDKQHKTRFTLNEREGTVGAPASDPKVVSVAGFDKGHGQMWRDSSRGPASRYSAASPTQSPAMAHLVHHLGQGAATPGTSFASPRAAADAAAALADPARRQSCTEVDKLIQETYGLLGIWDPRHGFHKQIN